MQLVMPMNYECLEQEEMTYLDGGDAVNFAKNMFGIASNAAIKRAIGLPTMATLLKMSYWTAIATFPGAMAKIASLTGNPVVIGIAALGGVAAVTYLWNVRVFY